MLQSPSGVRSDSCWPRHSSGEAMNEPKLPVNVKLKLTPFTDAILFPSVESGVPKVKAARSGGVSSTDRRARTLRRKLRQVEPRRQPLRAIAAVQVLVVAQRGGGGRWSLAFQAAAVLGRRAARGHQPPAARGAVGVSHLTISVRPGPSRRRLIPDACWLPRAWRLGVGRCATRS